MYAGVQKRQRDRGTLKSLHTEEERRGGRGNKYPFVYLANCSGKTEKWKCSISKVGVEEIEPEN